MKIVSLQSVGLGVSEDDGNMAVCPDYAYFAVGHPWMKDWYDRSSHEELHDDTDVVEIQLVPDGVGYLFEEMAHTAPASKDRYHVKLKNGHIMVLPADKYIAEYAPSEDGEIHE